MPRPAPVTIATLPDSFPSMERFPFHQNDGSRMRNLPDHIYPKGCPFNNPGYENLIRP
jgi:hypothetical protein